jgi:hypothetical protein
VIPSSSSPLISTTGKPCVSLSLSDIQAKSRSVVLLAQKPFLSFPFFKQQRLLFVRCIDLVVPAIRGLPFARFMLWKKTY